MKIFFDNGCDAFVNEHTVHILAEQMYTVDESGQKVVVALLRCNNIICWSFFYFYFTSCFFYSLFHEKYGKWRIFKYSLLVSPRSFGESLWRIDLWVSKFVPNAIQILLSIIAPFLLNRPILPAFGWYIF